MQDISGQGYYICTITKHTLSYSYLILYLSEEENDDFDRDIPLHVNTSISWLGNYDQVNLELLIHGNDIGATVASLHNGHREQMAKNYLFLNLIAEYDAKLYMMETVREFILQVLTRLDITSNL